MQGTAVLAKFKLRCLHLQGEHFASPHQFLWKPEKVIEIIYPLFWEYVCTSHYTVSMCLLTIKYRREFRLWYEIISLIYRHSHHNVLIAWTPSEVFRWKIEQFSTDSNFLRTWYLSENSQHWVGNYFARFPKTQWFHRKIAGSHWSWLFSNQ